MKELIGRKINRIFINEDYLKFDTDKGILIYTVDGDCCSDSVFYDFYGVKNLLKNGVVKSVEEIDLVPTDIKKVKNEWGSEEEEDNKSYQEVIQSYGIRIITEDKEFGDVSSVVSYRNYSNGYYGGSLGEVSTIDKDVLPEVFDDVIDTFKLHYSRS